ncbi:hypothetical protein ACO1O0_004343 [Amphichorda felina]
MAMGGEAPWAMGVMWLMVGLVFIFLMLRAYTRIFCLASFGIDDYIYMVAFLSAQIGFGQDLKYIGHDMAMVTKATLYECIGQGFAIIGMAIAKASLGFFFLRLVSSRWHRIAIWTAMALVSAASIVSTVLVDVFFAVLPWVIFWNLQMPMRDKYTIAGSMSLGLIAAAAGIKRTTEVEGLYTPNYLHDSVGLIVWSSAEMAITLICIGIPVCLPLYKSIYRRFRSGQSSNNTPYRSEQKSGSIPLQTIGGGYISKDGQHVSKSNTSSGGKVGRRLTDAKLGIRGTTTKTYIGGGGRKNSSGANTSDEEILGEQHSQNSGGQWSQDFDEDGRRGQGIVVTKSYRVDG